MKIPEHLRILIVIMTTLLPRYRNSRAGDGSNGQRLMARHLIMKRIPFDDARLPRPAARGRQPEWPRISLLLWGATILLGGLPSAAQSAAAQSVSPQAGAGAAAAATSPATGAGLALYRRLHNVGLDARQVFSVRDGHLDREDIHVTLGDGTLAFTEAVDGKITGAFFAGEGEVLILPPNPAERASLALFTRAAVLEEKFTTAYLRFSDDHIVEDLQPAMRPAEDSGEFVAKWNSAARSLGEGDTLRLLAAVTNRPPPGPAASGARQPGFIHLKVGGTRLGSFDIELEPDLAEQIYVGQANYVPGSLFYDMWMAFPMRSARRAEDRQRTRLTAPQASAGSSDFPPQGSGKEDAVHISKFQIKATVTPPTGLQAEATLTMQVREPGMRTFIFELSRNLKVSGVTEQGAPLEFIQNVALEGSQLARQGNDLVAVFFSQPAPPGSTLHLRFVYSGAVMSDAGNGLVYVGARGTWYPNRGFAMADFDLTFITPSKWTLLATGKEVLVKNTESAQLSHWISERPFPVAGFNLGQYQRSSAWSSEHGTLVEAYGTGGLETVPSRDRFLRSPRAMPEPPPQTIPLTIAATDDPATLQAIAKGAAKTIDFLSPKLGPFPFSSLQLTQIPGGSSQGWPGLVFLSSRAYSAAHPDLPGTPAQRSPLDYEQILYSDLMLAHETAHQWWGDEVFWKSYRDQWVMEALANYSALLMLESQDAEKFRVVMEYYRNQLNASAASEPAGPGGRDPQAVRLRTRDAGPVTLGVRLESSRFNNGYDAVAYGRGTWLFHMLRHMMRNPSARPAPGASSGAEAETAAHPDAAFYGVLRQLLKKFDGRAMGTADVQRAFEEALPRPLYFEGRQSLDWFFDGWVNGTALPALEFSNVKIFVRAGKSVASGTIQQKEAPQDLVTLVPVYAATSAEPLFLGRVFADGEETSFQFPVPPGTKKLLLDPFRTLLTKPVAVPGSPSPVT